jgi:hypothetical protein
VLTLPGRRQLVLLRSDTDGRLFRIARGIQERAVGRPALSKLVLSGTEGDVGGDSRFAESRSAAQAAVSRAVLRSRGTGRWWC